VQTKTADRGVQIALALVELKSGRTVSQTEGLHRTAVTAADLGLKAALVVDLKTSVDLNALSAAAKEAGTVRRVEGALVFPSVGAKGHLAVVYSNGKMVVAQQSALSAVRDVDALKETAIFLCGMIREVRSEDSEEENKQPRPAARKRNGPVREVQADARDCVTMQSRVFTGEPPTYRQISFHNLPSCDYIFTIPDCELREARLSAIIGVNWQCSGYWHDNWLENRFYDLSIDGKNVIDGKQLLADKQRARIGRDVTSILKSITGLCRSGEHSFVVTSHEHEGSRVILQFLLMAPANVWVTIRDKANNPVGTLSGTGGLTSELEMPVELAQ